MAVSIISNGSLISPQWMHRYGRFVDVLGISLDSFNPKTNALIGRGGDSNNQHASRVLRVRDLCKDNGIIFKINTVVNSLNWEEDMNKGISLLNPSRWKVFQVLLLDGENVGKGALKNAKPLLINNEKFNAFVNRHSNQSMLIPEPNDTMQNSYLLLDEKLRFLNCAQGGKVPSDSILVYMCLCICIYM
jgi:radical S-adenosyl methionine domain-containing protein 2